MSTNDKNNASTPQQVLAALPQDLNALDAATWNKIRWAAAQVASDNARLNGLLVKHGIHPTTEIICAKCGVRQSPHTEDQGDF